MNAPVCPINRSQSPSEPGMAPVLLPSIPIATDLPSLIRAVNIMREILRTVTTSLTVNNIWLPRAPRDPPKLPNKNYIMSPYPNWYQVNAERETGFVYYKSKSGKNQDDRAYIVRTDAVEFRNLGGDDDKSFFWRLRKPLDSTYGETNGVQPFEEDFFERVVNVHWSLGLAVEFNDGAG